MNRQLASLAGVGLSSFGPNPTANPAGAKKEVSRVLAAGSVPDASLSLSPGFGGSRSVEVRRLAEAPRRPAQALVARRSRRGRAWPGGQGGPRRAAPLVAGRVPDRGGLLLHPRLHPWHRGAGGRCALAHSHPLHSALDPLRGAADVQAGRRGEPATGRVRSRCSRGCSRSGGARCSCSCLLGFVATGWLVTITLSAADAAVHVAENPLVPSFLHDQEVLITLVLLAVLGAIFLKGFKEAIGIAVFIVGAYLLLNLVVVAVGFYEIATHPQSVVSWQDALFSNYGNPLLMIGASLLVFPRLALGLSGFETGVGMMPLVRGDEGDDPERPAGRIRNTRKMLTVAALIMSFYLITTSFVTTLLIPAREFEPGGSANGRALAYVAHNYLGDAFGTVYDLSTILILAFAGASAMAGLLEHRAPLPAPLRHGS